MPAPSENLPLKMARPNLDHLPALALPGEFSLRWYQPGDEAHWRRIHRAADRFLEITPELFRGQFGGGAERGLSAASTLERRSGIDSALQDLRERQCYLLEPCGEVIGTGTAWFDDNLTEGSGNARPFRSPSFSCAEGEREVASQPVDLLGDRWGRVHWMAIVPEFQRHGLGKVLLGAICQRLRELGHERAYLHTSAARIPAIQLYLRFGFAPVVRNAAERAVWKDVLASLPPASTAA